MEKQIRVEAAVVISVLFEEENPWCVVPHILKKSTSSTEVQRK